MFCSSKLVTIRVIPLLLVVFSVPALVMPTCVIAQTTRESATFRERLIAGLQVRRPSEFAFVDAVIDTVDRGELPQRLVDRFFFWARSRPATSVATSRPIIYFEQGLKIQAKKLKIVIARTPPPMTTP